jgi:hypothetical protein
MIANLAKFRNFHRVPECRFQAPACGEPCNDNHPVPRAVTAPVRRIRPILASRWRTTPAGALECVWHLQPAGTSTIEPQERTGRPGRNSERVRRHRRVIV